MSDLKHQNDELAPAGDTSENNPNSVKGGRKESTRYLLWAVCAAYLLYTVYSLIGGLVRGEVSGTVNLIVVVGGSAVFVAVAVFLLYRSIRFALGSFKSTMNAYDEAERAEKADIPELEEASEDE